MSAICIIPARGGSKRIPRKNVRDFCGRPIIAYSIDAALESGLFDEVMVSTDDAEIADISRSCGAAVPFMRSPATSGDFATTADVLLEVLGEYRAEGRGFDVLCCLYATAPFATAEKLREARELLDRSGAPAVIPVTSFDFPPQRAFSLRRDGSLEYVWPEHASARSQDLPMLVHDCGMFYFVRTSALEAHGTLAPSGAVAMRFPPQAVQDVDTPADWEMAEMKYERMVASRGEDAR